MKKNTLLFFLALPLFNFVIAQPDCKNYLDNAQKMYNQGQFSQAITVIQNCSLEEKNKVIQWQSSRLLSQCYLGLNDFKKANQSAEDMLEKNPLYKTSVIEDSKEFANLLAKVKVIPRFSLSLSFAAGINFSKPYVINGYGITDDKKTYSSGKGNQIGIFAGYNKSSRVSFHTGIIYSETNYSLAYKVQNIIFNYSENLNYVQTPLMFRYQFKPSGSLKIFAQVGPYTGFLTQSKYDFSRKTDIETTELKSIDQTDNRKKTTFGLMGGIGASYKFKEGHIFADINYQYALSNINKPENRLNNENQIYNYYYLEDDLRLNNLALSVGYTFYLSYFVQRSKLN